MSTRPRVDRQRIQPFLEALAAGFRSAGRVYLVGGTTLVYAGFRAPTLAIDLAYDLAARHHGDFIRTERELKNELEPNSKAASPGDFFPRPEGSAQRARFVGGCGRLDVFHFDPHSVALSQIERGRVADFAAVLALRGHGWIEFEALQTRCRESLPRVGGTQPEGRSGGNRTQVCLFAEPLAGRSPGGPWTYVRATHPSLLPGNRAARLHGAASRASGTQPSRLRGSGPVLRPRWPVRSMRTGAGQASDLRSGYQHTDDHPREVAVADSDEET